MRKRFDAEAMIQDPLVTGGGGQRRIAAMPDLEFGARRLPDSIPLPTAAEALCGFDAIFQFTTDLLGRCAASQISTQDHEIVYQDHVLSDEARSGVIEAIYGPVDPTLARVSRFGQHYEYESDAYIVRLRSPSFRFLDEGDGDRACFAWRFDLLLRRVETGESFTRRRGMELPDGLHGAPPGMSGGPTGVSTEGWGPMERVEEIFPLGSGLLEVFATPVVIADEELLSFRAKLDHTDWVINVESSDSLVSELLDLEDTTIRNQIQNLAYNRFLKVGAVSGYGVTLTPVVSLRPNAPVDALPLENRANGGSQSAAR